MTQVKALKRRKKQLIKKTKKAKKKIKRNRNP